MFKLLVWIVAVNPPMGPTEHGPYSTLDACEAARDEFIDLLEKKKMRLPDKWRCVEISK